MNYNEFIETLSDNYGFFKLKAQAYLGHAYVFICSLSFVQSKLIGWLPLMGHGNFKYSPTRTIRLSCFRSAVGGPEKIMLDDYLKIQIKFCVFRY